ncbi:MAG TPA: nicotinate phosphoribosyltransferase [Polyangiales bacterium]|nr:nicotinate phosphoribosyltransferase [Polyangiales bacterium]
MVSPLLTDLYQLTMAQGYLRSGRAQDRAVFHLLFRKLPFGGGYALVAGLEAVLELVETFRFEPDDLDYLGSLRTEDGSALFGADFLDYLRTLRLSVDIDALPEGTLAFGSEPLLRVQGNLIEAQLLETALLNAVNFPTLIATKAARICEAAGEESVLEFGLRRAQGIDGALTASRAAFIGGCSATSNVLAGKLYGIPVRGTHAHSWVMSFASESEAFEAYAEAIPNNCVFLVDTYDSLEGVRNAIRVGLRLRERGKRLLGIRLDSGDLAWLSNEARALLDAAGFQDAFIVGSNDLDEHLIASLKQQGTSITVWGVGTKLVTAYDQPALGGVYKLSMIGRDGGPLEPRIKLSEQAAKISNPGIQQVRRFSRNGKLVADAIFDEQHGCASPTVIVDPLDPTRRRKLAPDLDHEDLLVPAVRGGKVVAERPTLPAIQARAKAQLAALSPSVRRMLHPHEYPVGLTRELFAERVRLVEELRVHPER